MSKAKLIKRNELLARQATANEQPKVSIGNTVNVIKDWLQTKNKNTKQNAREAFANLFASPQKPCTDC